MKNLNIEFWNKCEPGDDNYFFDSPDIWEAFEELVIFYQTHYGLHCYFQFEANVRKNTQIHT